MGRGLESEVLRGWHKDDIKLGVEVSNELEKEIAKGDLKSQT